MKTEKVIFQLEDMIHRGDLRPGDRLQTQLISFIDERGDRIAVKNGSRNQTKWFCKADSAL